MAPRPPHREGQMAPPLIQKLPLQIIRQKLQNIAGIRPQGSREDMRKSLRERIYPLYLKKDFAEFQK